MPKAEKVSLLVVNVDGTLTDGKIYIDQDGNEIKSFYAQDGPALRMLMDAGIRVAFLTGRTSRSVEKIASELGVTDLFQGAEDKFAVLSGLLAKFNLGLSEVAFIGDDLTDLPLIRQVGFSFAPANARSVVREFAGFVTKADGGEGAVAEICEKILRQQGKWDELLSGYL